MTTRTTVVVVLVLLLMHIALAADDVAAVKKLKAPGWTVPSVKMKMKLIPAGTFTMGSPKGEIDRRDDEVQHKVTISRPFYMGVYEVTQKQYYDIMLPDFDHDDWQYARGPIHAGLAYFYRKRTHRGDYKGGKLNLQNPMECVTWDKAREFCRKITDREQKADRLPKGYVYRLPTEAEWEYACRAGTTGPYNVKGSSDEEDYLRSPGHIRTFANVESGSTEPVGRRKPNAWGLYDMHGNVYEWCLDWYGPYDTKAQKDPTGPAKGTNKVARGACLNGAAPYAPPGALVRGDCYSTIIPFLRSASRYQFDPDVNFYGILGFRVVLAPQVTAK